MKDYSLNGRKVFNFYKKNIESLSAGFIVFGYALTPFFSKSINNFFEVLLGIYFFYILLIDKNNLRKDKMVIIFFLIFFAQIASWVSVRLFYSEFAYIVPKIDRLCKLFLFIPIAFYLRKFQKLPYLFLVTALLGFFVGIILKNDLFSLIPLGLDGYRLDFGIRNAQHSSMVFGIILLFSTVSLFLMAKNRLEFAALAVLICICCFGLMFTQSRQSFLALTAAFAFINTATFFLKTISLRKKIIKIFFTLILLLCLVQIGNLGSRFESVNGLFTSFKIDQINGLDDLTLEDKVSICVKSLPGTSGGIRLKTWLNAIPWILEKPILGWGSEARTFSIKNSKILPDEIKDKFGHLHNFHIELILSYGLIGACLLGALYFWLIFSAFKVWSAFKSEYNTYILILAAAFILYWFTINNFESMNSFWTGVFVHNIFCGFIYSNYFRTGVKK